MLEVTVYLDSQKQEPLYQQLYQYLKKEIETGSITAGRKLPSKRKLAEHLGISTLTVETAFAQLKAEGYVSSKPRQGLYVEHLEGLIQSIPKPVSNLKLSSVNQPTSAIDFNHGRIDLTHFPYSIWRKASLEAINNPAHLETGPPQGEPHLRQEIADYLFQSRGVRCRADQIILGAGTAYLLDLLSKLFDPAQLIAFEEPGFHRSKNAFLDRQFHIQSIPVDQEGICIDNLIKHAPKLVYVTPSHQFPTGVIMSISRRLALLRWAEQAGSYIIEDDYDGEFRYKGSHIPSLQGIDPLGKVVYLGTFSKSFIPSARISYMILPDRLLNQYQEIIPTPKQTVSRMYQEILYTFMKKGYWERHLNKMRTIYRQKYQVLIASIAEHLGDQARIIGGPAGLHLLLEIVTRLSEDELIIRAEKNGVRVYPTSIYYDVKQTQQKPKLLLGFGGLSHHEIEDGIKRLKLAIQS